MGVGVYFSTMNRFDLSIDAGVSPFGYPSKNLSGAWGDPWRSEGTTVTILARLPTVSPVSNVALWHNNFTENALLVVRVLGEPVSAGLTWSSAVGLVDNGDGSWVLTNWSGTLTADVPGAIVLQGESLLLGDVHDAEGAGARKLVEGMFTGTGVSGTVTVAVHPILHRFEGPAIGPQVFWGAETWGTFRQDLVSVGQRVYPRTASIITEVGLAADAVWISIEDGSNPDGFLEANQLCIGRGDHVFRGGPIGASHGYVKDTTVTWQPWCRTFAMTFENVRAAQAANVLHRMPFDEPFLFSLTPFAMTEEDEPKPDWAMRQVNTAVVRRVPDTTVTTPFARYGTVSVSVQEINDR